MVELADLSCEYELLLIQPDDPDDKKNKAFDVQR